RAERSGEGPLACCVTVEVTAPSYGAPGAAPKSRGASEATGESLGASEATGETHGASEATGETHGASEATGESPDRGVPACWTFPG
ncbi:hypothetical protein C6A88_02405, partial [Mycolicibacterium austroafricanum]